MSNNNHIINININTILPEMPVLKNGALVFTFIYLYSYKTVFNYETVLQSHISIYTYKQLYGYIQVMHYRLRI